jgi:hypothetical protein
MNKPILRKLPEKSREVLKHQPPDPICPKNSPPSPAIWLKLETPNIYHAAPSLAEEEAPSSEGAATPFLIEHLYNNVQTHVLHTLQSSDEDRELIFLLPELLQLDGTLHVKIRIELVDQLHKMYTHGFPK